LDGTQQLTILGVGFASDARVFWQTPTGVVEGPDIPIVPAAPSSLIVSKNLGAQSATWQVQVENPTANMNSKWLSFQVTANTSVKPDLVPENLTLSTGSLTAGNAVTVDFTVLNQGNGPAVTSTTGFRIGTSNTVPPGPSGDIPNSSISTHALTAGQSVQQAQTLTIPSATTAGTYYIWIVVDDVVNSTLGQSNTANDYAGSPALTVTAGQTPVPTPISPGTLTDTGFLVTATTPTMQWSGSGATTYELTISKAPYGSANVVYDNTTIAGSATLLQIPSGNLYSGSKYAWNMRASNTAGQSSWSSTLYFQTPTTTPAVPTNLSPGSTSSPGPTTGSTTVTLNWSGTSGATYEVAIKDVATGTFIDDTTISATTFTATNLVAGKKYVWNVDACSGTQCSAFAQALYFQTP
jgi:CARDB